MPKLYALLPYAASVLLLGSITGASAQIAAPDTLWTRTYRNGGLMNFADMVRAHEGVLMAGTAPVEEQPSSIALYLMRTDLDGKALWTRVYESGWTNSYVMAGDAIPTADGGFLITAARRVGDASDAPNHDWLLRLDADGDTLWTRSFGIVSNGQEHLVEGADGKIFVTYMNGVHLLNADGTPRESPLDDAEYPGVIEMIPHASGGVVVMYGSGLPEHHLVHLDGNGHEVWRRVWEPRQSEGSQFALAAACLASDGGYLCTGAEIVHGESLRFSVQKLSSDGDLLWSLLVDLTGRHEIPTDVAATPDGGCVVTGISQPTRDRGDVKTVRIDGSGRELWSLTYGSAAFEATIGRRILPLEDGSYIIGGHDGFDGPPLALHLARTTYDPTSSITGVRDGQHYGPLNLR